MDIGEAERCTIAEEVVNPSPSRELYLGYVNTQHGQDGQREFHEVEEGD